MSESPLTPIAQQICEKRYFRKDKDGNIIEDWEGLVNRVVNHVCKQEDDAFKNKVFNLMYETKFLPNSPCLVNSGNAVSGLLACNVSPDVEDSWVGMVKNIELFGHIARRGGGNGVCLSKIRPAGSPVFGSTHAKACGPIQHMIVVSEAMHSITQSGFRAMANMSTLHVNHPDIVDFIHCKQRKQALRHFLREDLFNHFEKLQDMADEQINTILDKHIANFNISVVVSDKFMEAVKNDGDFDLEFGGKVYNTIKARELFNTIVENAWNNGDPGLLFDDAVNDGPYKYSGQKITATNPCFHGNSLVAVADGRGFVPIKQLASEKKDVPVYCCEPDTGNIYIKLGRNPRKTRSNAKLCKVTFDDGGQITTTPDHKILLSNGEYIEVQNLSPNYSVRIMTKFEYMSGSKKYKGIVQGNGKHTIPEHRMIHEFYNGTLSDEEVVHHKDFNSLNNQIDNLEKMSKSDHSKYHRSINNPMTHWFPNLSESEKQEYRDKMSIAKSGHKNGMYGKSHSVVSKSKIGNKTSERCKDQDYRQNLSNKTKATMTKERKLELSIQTKKHWEEGKYNNLKSEMITKKCEWCNTEFSRKPCLAENLRFCSTECGNQIDILDTEIINNAIEFIELFKTYPTVSTWKIFENSICSRELIRTRFGNFQKLSEKLIDIGIFAKIAPNTKMTSKIIASAVVEWTLRNGHEPSNKEIIRDICSYGSLKNNGGYEKIIIEANNLCISNGVNHKVVSVEILEETADVFNITVDDFHNLCVFSSEKQKIKKDKTSVSRYYTIVYKNCGEQPLPEFGSCNLASIDVSKFYDENTNDLDWKSFRKTIHICVRFLDNVIDANKFPTKEFEKWAKENRPVGLGVMGLSDLLLKIKLAYGSDGSIEFAEKMSKFLENEAHKESKKLAVKKGTPKSCRYDELDHRRNVTLTSIAPTGSISLIAGCSSSIEPIFSPTVYVYNNTGQYEMPHNDAKKSHFRSAINPDTKKEVKWEEHIKMQAAFQKHGSSGISKTINLRNDATKKDVADAYMYAWENKCKGVTVYRDGSKSTQVLNTTDKGTIGANKAKSRPKEVSADIFKTKADGMDWHIIVGKVDENPYEIFAVNGKVDLPDTGIVVKRKRRHYSLIDIETRESIIDNIGIEEEEIHPDISLETRRFSLELRHGIHPKYIIEQIDKSNKYMTSFSKASSRVLKKYVTDSDLQTISTPCPDCAKNGEFNEMISEAGCWRCPNPGCGFSKCG